VCPDGYVYNLEVRGIHTYVANGFVVHNCHDAPDELASYLEVEVGARECERAGVEWPLPGYELSEWVSWAEHWGDKVAHEVEWFEAAIAANGKLSGAEWKDLARRKNLLRKLARIAAIGNADEWIAEAGAKDENVKLSLLWPHLYAERELFRGAKKVVLVSATVRPKTLGLLGVREADCDFREYASSFPVERRPVVHVECVQMRHNMPPEYLEIWAQKIDAILNGRSDRKGVVHTVSYARARYLLEHTRHKGRMLAHQAHNRADVVERFKKLPPESGAVLVSPSVDTGYDFPYDQCRYQVISKLPFPDMRSAVLRQRMEVDKEYRDYVTAQSLVQMAGRGMRAADDLCETIIVDDQMKWFVWKAEKFLPKWFRDAYRSVSVVPAPMKLSP
jgi:Rad3-related DNA helicase